VNSNTDVQTDIVITIRTSSLKKAEAISKLAAFKGDIKIELPKQTQTKEISRSDSSQAILSLLQRQYATKEFSYIEAKDLVKIQLNRGESTTRRILQVARQEGILTRVKTGVYSFLLNQDVKKQAIEDEPNHEREEIPEIAS